MLTRFFYLVTLTILFACGGETAQSSQSPAGGAAPGGRKFDMLAHHVRSRMLLSDDCSAGGAVVIYRGKLVCEEYFGTLYRGNDAPPVNARSRFPFYSISKGFGAGVLASLVSAGKLSLDDPVSKYLPHFTGTGPGGEYDRGAVTVRTLASHSSGLPQDDSPPRRWPGGEPFHDVVLEFEPGTSFLYSELAMRLLGEVMERASGKGYDELVREHLVDPLGLETVDWLNKGADTENVVRTCTGLDSAYIAWSDEYAPKPYPGSGLYGSLRDIALYAQLWLDGGEIGGRRVFSEDYITTAWENQPPGRDPDPAYGQLFWLFPEIGTKVFSGAAHTICAIVPEDEIVVVMGLNQRGGGPGWNFETEKLNLGRLAGQLAYWIENEE